jgi:diguanylate cyclase (GGDEF)-like protein
VFPASRLGPSPASERLWRLRRRFGGLTGVAILTAATMLLSAAVAYLGYLLFAPDLLRYDLALLMPVVVPLPVALPVYALILHVIDDLAAEVERRRASEETLRVHATYDHLTALLNRRSVLDVLIGRLADEEVLGVLWIDIDHFKQINDEQGHLRGDQVLRMVASTMRELVGSDGHVGRMGGEEFLVVLTTRSHDLAQTVRRIGRGVHGVGHPDCTVSIGGTLCLPGDSIDALLRRADSDLYVAKRAGRDRGVVDGAEIDWEQVPPTHAPAVDAAQQVTEAHAVLAHADAGNPVPAEAV